jgi:hypothetical protein
MEMKPGQTFRQAKRAFITDEMNLVAASGQVFPERGGEDPAPADGRVTGDADLERAGRRHGELRIDEPP